MIVVFSQCFLGGSSAACAIVIDISEVIDARGILSTIENVIYEKRGKGQTL